jgi:nicotinamidase-related amidase
MNSKTTAILFIEFQNEFVRPGGQCFNLVRDEMSRQHTLAHAVKLMEIARKKQILCVQIPFISQGDFIERHNVRGLVADLHRQGMFKRGSWGGDQIEEMRPKAQFDDVMIHGKCALSGFSHTQLEQILRQRGIRHVIVCGFLTNLCVEGTARSAYDRGFTVTIARDATAATSREHQDYVENVIAPLIGEAMTVDEIEAKLD